MAERALTPAEVKALGLDKAERELSDDEVKALGLDAPAAPKKVPSPTGWVDPAKAGGLGDLDAIQRDQERQGEAMWGALSAGAHGLGGVESQLNGLAAAAGKDFKTSAGGAPATFDDLLSTYRAERNRIEGAQKENLKRFPAAPVVGAVLAGGVGQAPTALGRVGLSGLQGAAYGFGSSKGDLTKGEVGPVLKDAGKGLGFGVAGGVAGEGLNAGAGVLGDKLGKVIQSGDNAAALAAQKTFNSARGAFGGDVSAGSNQLKLLSDALLNPNADPALRRAAEGFLASPEGSTLLNQVLRSNIGRAEGQTARIAASQAAMGEAANGLAPEAVQAASAARRNDPSALLRRLREVLPKVVLPAAGAWLGGPEGAAAGALGAAVLGRSGTTVRNMMTDPYVASRVLGTGMEALGGSGGAMSRATPSMLQAYIDAMHDKESKQ